MKAWILYEIDLLHAISCHDRVNIGLQTSFEEFQISQCATNFQQIHLVFRLPSLVSPLSLMSQQDLSVALFGLPGKLNEFNNIGSLISTLYVTSLFVQNTLNCSFPNFDILGISSYTSLKVDFSFLNTVNLFNLNIFVRIVVFSLKISAEN